MTKYVYVCASDTYTQHKTTQNKTQTQKMLSLLLSLLFLPLTLLFSLFSLCLAHSRHVQALKGQGGDILIMEEAELIKLEVVIEAILPMVQKRGASLTM